MTFHHSDERSQKYKILRHFTLLYGEKYFPIKLIRLKKDLNLIIRKTNLFLILLIR